MSWIRKGDDDLQLLTIGEMSHTSDPRIEAEFVYPHFWPLKFKPALTNDSGLYLCHVATDPPLIRFVYFNVSGTIQSTAIHLISDGYSDVKTRLKLHAKVPQRRYV